VGEKIISSRSSATVLPGDEGLRVKAAVVGAKKNWGVSKRGDIIEGTL